MIWTILLALILLLGVGVLVWLFVKKLPQLKMMDPSTAKDSKSRQLKYEIMRQRVERAGGAQVDKLTKSVFSPIGKGFQNAVRTVAGKLTAVERKYQERKHQSGESTLGKDELDARVVEARKLMDEEKWDRAEKKFIEVISNDPKHEDAYEYLGRLYQYRKDYKLAKQTFQFLKKLSPNNASVIASIGEVEEKMGESAKALKNYKKAVDLSPKNPKYLDFLIAAALKEKNLHEAQQALEQLEKVNPDNKKIEKYGEKVKDLRTSLISKGE